MHHRIVLTFHLCDWQRDQEWNISRKELLELVEVGVLTEDDIDNVTSSSFNPVRRFMLERRGRVSLKFEFLYFFSIDHN